MPRRPATTLEGAPSLWSWAHARMEVIPADNGHAEVRMSIEYTPKLGVLGKAMNG